MSHVLKASVAVTVQGRVTSGTGEALPGVNVLVKGTSNGTATNVEGKYTLTIPDEQAGGTLLFSYIGYVSQEVKISGQTLINVALASDSKNLSDVVVVGYGTQNRRDVTGAVSTVKAPDLNQTNAVSVDNLLQGRAAGLNISSNTS